MVIFIIGDITNIEYFPLEYKFFLLENIVIVANRL